MAKEFKLVLAPADRRAGRAPRAHARSVGRASPVLGPPARSLLEEPYQIASPSFVFLQILSSSPSELALLPLAMAMAMACVAAAAASTTAATARLVSPASATPSSAAAATTSLAVPRYFAGLGQGFAARLASKNVAVAGARAAGVKTASKRTAVVSAVSGVEWSDVM